MNRKLAQTNPKKGMLTTKPCHCREVLKRVLSPLTQHCLIIGETTCAFYYLLESAAASLDLSDNYMVSKLCSLPLSWTLWLGGIWLGFLTNKYEKTEESGREAGAVRGLGESAKWKCGSEECVCCRCCPDSFPHSPAPHFQLNPVTVQILHNLGPAVVLITSLAASES